MYSCQFNKANNLLIRLSQFAIYNNKFKHIKSKAKDSSFFRKLGLKHGAMFGLDARIALIIFGSLSLISGASLYSAIQKTKEIQFIQNLIEIGKAYEAYILDTGSEIRTHNTTYGLTRYLAMDSSSNPIAGWAGPYLQFELKDSKFLEHPFYGDYVLIDLAEDEDWVTGSKPRASSFPCKTANTTCWAWSRIEADLPLSFAKALDMRVDGDDSPTTGNLRYRYPHDSVDQEIYYKYMPAFSQPNL